MDRNDALLADWRQRALSLEAEVGQARDRPGACAAPGQHRGVRARPRAAAGRRGRGQDDAAARLRAGARRRLRAHRGHRRPDAQRPRLLHLHQRAGPPGRRARPADPPRRGPGDLLLQRDQPRPPAGACAAAARDGRAQRVGLQPRVPLPAPAGVRRPQPRRARRDLRDLLGGARPLHDGDHHRRAGGRRAAPRADVRPALPRHRPAGRCAAAGDGAAPRAERAGRADPAQRAGLRRAAELRARAVARHRRAGELSA